MIFLTFFVKFQAAFRRCPQGQQAHQRRLLLHVDAALLNTGFQGLC